MSRWLPAQRLVSGHLPLAEFPDYLAINSSPCPEEYTKFTPSHRSCLQQQDNFQTPTPPTTYRGDVPKERPPLRVLYPRRGVHKLDTTSVCNNNELDDHIDETGGSLDDYIIHPRLVCLATLGHSSFGGQQHHSCMSRGIAETNRPQ